MAFNDYILAEDRDQQSALIVELEKLNDQNISKVSYRAGICFMLSTNWLLRCAAAPTTAPNQVWRDMRKENIYYFKQIAQQQAGMSFFYNRGDYNNPDSFFKAATDAVELGSRKARHVKKLTPSDTVTSNIPGLATLVKNGLAASTTTPKMVLIYFVCNGGAHCIAAAQPADNKIYLYDPNAGIAIIDEAHGQSLATAMGDMNTMFNYQIGFSQVVPLT